MLITVVVVALRNSTNSRLSLINRGDGNCSRGKKHDLYFKKRIQDLYINALKNLYPVQHWAFHRISPYITSYKHGTWLITMVSFELF